MFVIRRTNRPGFVAKPGSKSSYATSLKHARKFRAREDAQADLCPENEVVEDLEVLLNEYRN